MAEDARIRKTKHKLSAALVELLQEKAFDDISPAEVCERAGVNRSTFYRNYKNILQLKTEMENKILSGIRWTVGNAEKTDLQANIFKQLEFLRENKDLFLALSASGFRESIFEKVRNRAIAVARESYTQLDNVTDKEELDNLCVFYISAVIGLVDDWFMGGMVQSSESLAAFLAPWMREAVQRLGI